MVSQSKNIVDHAVKGMLKGTKYLILIPIEIVGQSRPRNDPDLKTYVTKSVLILICNNKYINYINCTIKFQRRCFEEG